MDIWSLLLAGFLFMAVYIMDNAADSLTNVAEEPVCAIPLDLHMFGTSMEQASEALACMGSEGRKIYRQVESREDVFYPLIYSLFFSFTLFALSSFCIHNKNVTQIVSALPFVVMTADFFENFFIIKLIDQFPQLNNVTLSSFSFANTIKWGLSFIMFFLVGIFCILSLRKITKKSV